MFQTKSSGSIRSIRGRGGRAVAYTCGKLDRESLLLNQLQRRSLRGAAGFKPLCLSSNGSGGGGGGTRKQKNEKKKTSANRTTKEEDASSNSLVMGVIKPKVSSSSSRGGHGVDLSKKFERRDLVMLRNATLLAKSSQGQVSPFPYAGCVLVSRKNKVVAETFQYASGTEACEIQALDLAGNTPRK